MWTRLIATILLALFATVATASNQPVPQKLDECLDEAAREFLVISGKTDNEVRKKTWRLFLKRTHHYLLGKRAYNGGQTWKSFGRREKDYALRLYFDTLFNRGLEESNGVKDKRKTNIKKRLAVRTDLHPKLGYDVIVVLTLDNGKKIFARLLVTHQCQIFDFGNGSVWASSLVDAAMVENHTFTSPGN